MSTCPKCGRPSGSGTVGGFSAKDLQSGQNMQEQKSNYSAGYWKSTAGDCEKFRAAAANKTEANDAWCKQQGGTGTSPCLELAHSCLSTTVCQVFNYIYAKGAFAEQCGKFGEPVGNVIWYASGFETAAALIKVLWDNLRCFGASKGTCWPNVEQVWAAYVQQAQQIVASIEDGWHKMRADAGLPVALPCISIQNLAVAAMLARGEIPAAAGPELRDRLREEMGWDKPVLAAVSGTAFNKCPNGLDVDQALIEMSLWSDLKGFGQSLSNPSNLHFLDQDNFVRMGSWPIKSRVQMLRRPASVPLEGWWEPEVDRTAPVSSFFDVPSAQHTSDVSPQSSPFNIHMVQKGGPEQCKGISADNDARLCAHAAGMLFDDRLSALHRAAPYVVGAMSAQIANEAMAAAQAKQPAGMSTGAKVAVGVGAATAVGVGGYFLWTHVLSKLL